VVLSPRRYPAGVRPSARLLAALAALAALCSVALGACGNVVQAKPIPHNILESMLLAPYPVYWLGGTFQGLEITEASHDPSGAFSVQYGDCLEGGQGTCVPPLRVVTSPDNSFLPGGSTPSHRTDVRGVRAVVAQAGRTIEIPTGGVVVDIYASEPSLAAAAAETVVPINGRGAPQAPLPAQLPDTGFGSTPLPAQVPSPLRALR
jgi:hypothetical protein